MERKKITAPDIKARKQGGKVSQRIAMVTGYDATFASLLDESGVDVILVGDSLGMVVQGHSDTLPVTVDEMIYHCRAVQRGNRFAHVVCDMPFMSYQSSTSQALKNAGRLMKEGRAEAVKIEGGAAYADLVARLLDIGIPVMGHLGLTPQSVHQMGGFRVQGQNDAQAEKIFSDAVALAEAGVYALVLEGIPADLAERVTQAVACPTVGIGAGAACDGQVLVIYDLLGMKENFQPKFVKRYDTLGVRIKSAVASYIDEVRAGSFPAAEHTFGRKKGG